ncbi:Asparagine-rich protein (ARP protein) [Entomophthora muscae]|uniref:Asparagine-rich protein (ARP protein) n=1 Tax=Entomophthora muscae TaxID=34485 RepID=A0ACC2UMP8_9FUNG|nr:Asparagine-rich protein (ARP protein) [Entomophthora muscae]
MIQAARFRSFNIIRQVLHFSKRNKSSAASIFLEVRPGDWKCSKCCTHNFRSRIKCYGCSQHKPISPIAKAFKYTRGDWVCKKCQIYNFTHRKSCISCGSAVNEEGQTKVRAAVAALGNWDCISCNKSNFSWREICFKCQSPRPPKEFQSDKTL